MKVERLILGPLETNCYLIIKNNMCLIVDPADSFSTIKKALGNLNLVGILITHYHFDHIGALDDLKKYYHVPVYDYRTNEINIDGFDIEIIHNPGHTSDSTTFYFPQSQMMFVGDFVFKGSIGRTDLDTGSKIEMMDSLNELKKYKENLILYPGHGDSTTLNYEKENNIYFKN